MTIASNFPAIKPSLMLDFANTKRLDPRVTFTRATTGTYYDGVTTAKAEENLLLQSQNFSTTWTVAGTNATVTTDTTTAPDGTTTADSLTDDATNGVHRVAQTVTTSSTAQMVFSVFAKYSTMQWIGLSAATGTSTWAGAKFDVQNGVLGSTSQQGTGWTANSSSITSVGGGWYRCVLVFTPGASGSTTILVNCATDGTTFTTSQRGSEIYTGSGSTVFIWGAQLEQRSSVTSYTATTTQEITNYIPVLLTAASGVPRFNHNPTTDESLGLLIEEQRTNLLTYSEDFSDAAWTKSGSSITSNTIVAPDGTLTGDKLFENTATSSHQIRQSSTVADNTTVTASAFLKAGERTTALLGIATKGGAFRVRLFDLANGTNSQPTEVGYTTVPAGYGMKSVGNGWYYCWVSDSVATGAITTEYFRTFIYNGAVSYTGDGYSGIYIWGAQLEAGAFPTSYIATTAATVTRNADAASMTGSNFTSWFNAGEGTIYFEAQTAQGNGSYPFSLFGSSTSNRIYANYTTNARIQCGIRVNNTFEVAADTPTSSAPLNTFGKGATAYKVNDFGFSWNGAAALTDTSTTLPIIQQLDIGNNGGLATNWLNGTIKKIAYYPLRVTDAQLQALTS